MMSAGRQSPGSPRRSPPKALLAAVLAATLATLAVLISPAQAASPANELVYVANADTGPVTAYPAAASGAIHPSRTVANPNLPNSFWDPWGVTFDTSKHLFVQTFLSEATSFVFPPHAHGRVAPVRVFMADGPDTRSIAVDLNGYEYVASGQASALISVVAPRANGRPSDLYHVPAIRTIPTDEAVWWPWADILTTDGHGDLIAAIVRSQRNAIEVFQGGPTGGTRPLRVISGPHTGLGSCGGSPGCDQMSVTYSQRTGEIFVAVSSATGAAGAAGTAGTHISVFAANADGDVAPLRTIAGSRSGLAGNVVTGIAVSQTTGEIYAMVKTSDFGGHGNIDVYRGDARGDTTPGRTFTDSSTGFADGLGIALSSSSSSGGS